MPPIIHICKPLKPIKSKQYFLLNPCLQFSKLFVSTYFALKTHFSAQFVRKVTDKWHLEEFCQLETSLNESKSGQKCHKTRVSDSVPACPDGHCPMDNFGPLVKTDPPETVLFLGEKPVRVQNCPKCPNFTDS